MLFLWYPWKFHLLNPPVRFFSGIAHCQRRLVRNIFFPFFNIITWFNIIDIEMGNTSIYSCSHIYWKLSLHYFCHSFAKLTLWEVGTTHNWEINHPELTCGLLQTCTIKAIMLLLYFLRYFLPKHVRVEQASKENVCYGYIFC